MGIRTTTPVEYDNNLNYPMPTNDNKDNSENPKDSKQRKTIRPMSLTQHRKNNADVMTKQFLSNE